MPTYRIDVSDAADDLIRRAARRRLGREVTAADRKAFAEGLAADALRDTVAALLVDELNDASNIARRTALEELETAWPAPIRIV